MARKTDHAAAARAQLKIAQASCEHLDGHLLVLHHLDVALVHALLGSEAAAKKAIALADEHAGSDAYKDALSGPVFVHEYALRKAKIHAALSRGDTRPGA